MRNMQLDKLKRHSDKYFKTKIGIVKPDKFTRREIRYITKRSYQALTKEQKKYIENPSQIIENIVNQIVVSGEVGKINPFNALKQYSQQRQRETNPRIEFAKETFAMFRQEYPSLYAKYNSYMYRLGYSSANYFYENAEWNARGSVVTATLELPTKLSGVVYETLEITRDASDSTYLVAEMW